MRVTVFVDLARIRSNIESIRARTGVEVLVMVKADGYGHGMLPVAAATETSVDMFGVATVEEGAALRRHGIEKAVLVAAPRPEELEECASLRLTAALYGEDVLRRAVELRVEGADLPDFHLKLDTGMRRLGFSESALPSVIARLITGGVELTGCYSHLRCVNEAQLTAFKKMTAAVKEAFPGVKTHLASSAALDRKNMRFDMVRVGFAAYDGAMTVVSEVVESRRVKRGEFVGYGCVRAERDTNLAIVFGGYADGVARNSPSGAVLRGRYCPPIGRVCMDMFAVDTGKIEARPGEIAVLAGGDLPFDTAAELRDTIEYTVMTGWHGRIRRIYFNDKE